MDSNDMLRSHYEVVSNNTSSMARALPTIMEGTEKPVPYQSQGDARNCAPRSWHPENPYIQDTISPTASIRLADGTDRSRHHSYSQHGDYGSPNRTDRKRYASLAKEHDSHHTGIYDSKLKQSSMPSHDGRSKGMRASHIMIQVAPGLSLRLRGVEETLKAVEIDFYLPNECIVCTATIFSIQDVAFFVCPLCRTFSPAIAVNDSFADGVGLGFTLDDLAQWQAQILRQMR